MVIGKPLAKDGKTSVAEIQPFRGVRYNQSLAGDLAALICPPYDIISPQMQQELYHRSENNFVRIEFTRELPQDTGVESKYTRAAATLEKWLAQGVLEADDEPALYIHDHYFTYQGKEHKRRSVVAAVKLEEWDSMVIRPHEGTLARPKSDRISMLWACQANTSSIMALYEDREQNISSVLSAEAKKEPVISVDNADGEGHRVWAVTEPEATGQICRSLAREPFYIADGHHRYESALTYQRERRACSPSASVDEAYNFVMMTLIDFADPGLIVLPPHRLVRGMSRANLEGLAAKLESFFDVEDWSTSKPGIWQQVDDILSGEDGQSRLVIFGLAPERLLVLRLRDRAMAGQMMPYFHSELYKGLMVSVVDHIILERVLAVDSEREEAVLGYSYDREDAVSRVLNQEYQLAMLLSPIEAEVVKAVADASDRMPRKSTYFYPKAPAGLVFRRLV